MADTFPEITVELKAYKSHPRNYNRHPASQIERLRASLRKFGQPRNIVVWRKYFVAGHGVAQAAMAEGWATLRANEIPADWPETRVMAFLAADNELSRLSDPDQAALAALIDEARQFDGELLAAIGYDDREFDALLKEVGKATTTTNGDAPPQVDRADELRKLWQVEPGQLWRVGEHRLVCGDCTDPATVAKVMAGEKAAVVFTDPPYNVASHGRNYAADAPTQKKTYEALKNADWDKDFDITAFFPACETAMGDDCAVYICTSHWLVQMIWEWMWKWSAFCSYCVWCKPNPAPSLAKRHWTWSTELIAYAVRGRHVFNFPESGHALNWWEVVSPSHTTPHPTEKPREIPERAIRHSSAVGQIVFDCFAGSGTTLVACQNLQRKARAIELSPAYCGVILQRMRDAFPGIEIERID